MAISINPNMFEIPSPFLPLSPPSPPPPPVKPSHLPMLYYGLIVVGTAAFVLALYNLVVIKWCSNGRSRPPRGENRLFDPSSSQSFQNMNLGLASSFKYSKEGVAQEQAAAGYECAVCLSVFEEGEDVRKLPKCKHSFHAPCIDMWLYSHTDCPLCRARVDLPVVHGQAPPENPRARLRDPEEVCDELAPSDSNHKGRAKKARNRKLKNCVGGGGGGDGDLMLKPFSFIEHAIVETWG